MTMAAPTFHEVAQRFIHPGLGEVEIDENNGWPIYKSASNSSSKPSVVPLVDPGLNESGIQPVEYKVLVKLDPPEEVSKAGIIVSTGDETEREAMAQVKGTLVAIGHNAFFDWKWKPSVGMRVMIAKHEGIICRGAEQESTERPSYRLCMDKQISAVLTKE
jgi:co-chaperonin GroES (HSP10)